MGSADDDRYVRYVVARLASFRNVWWSLANEFDLMEQKTDADWDRLFQIVQHDDPSNHLRSVHHSQRMYDPSKPCLTHLSVQNGIACGGFRPGGDLPAARAQAGRLRRGEVRGQQPQALGPAQRRGAGPALLDRHDRRPPTSAHGEIFMRDDRQTWLRKGGVLARREPKRIGFLKQILSTAPVIDPIDQYYQTHIGGKPGSTTSFTSATRNPPSGSSSCLATA
jgi:hypothetical protein